jgi:hypothetical protein
MNRDILITILQHLSVDDMRALCAAGAFLSIKYPLSTTTSFEIIIDRAYKHRLEYFENLDGHGFFRDVEKDEVRLFSIDALDQPMSTSSMIPHGRSFDIYEALARVIPALARCFMAGRFRFFDQLLALDDKYDEVTTSPVSKNLEVFRIGIADRDLERHMKVTVRVQMPNLRPSKADWKSEIAALEDAMPTCFFLHKATAMFEEMHNDCGKRCPPLSPLISYTGVHVVWLRREVPTIRLLPTIPTTRMLTIRDVGHCGSLTHWAAVRDMCIYRRRREPGALSLFYSSVMTSSDPFMYDDEELERLDEYVLVSE